jgi:Ca2+-binding EF-hand superfamily protein
LNKTTENDGGQAERSAVAGAEIDVLSERQALSDETESESNDGIIALNSDGTAAAGEARGLFDRFDNDLDGELDFEEFTNYLTSVFEAMASTAAFQAQALTPAEMAKETATECFEEADLDGDGALTFDEFKTWYLQSQNQQ